MLPTTLPHFAPVTFSYPDQTPRHPISHRIIECMSSYLSLNPRQIFVVECNSNDQPTYFYVKPSEGRPPWFLTTLKVLSYFTMILPILALASNLFFRSYLNLRTLTLLNQIESPLFQLPDEILSIILEKADMASRSAFALTCKKGNALVERIRIRQVPLDLRKKEDPFLTVQHLREKEDPFLTVQHLLRIPIINRLEETYSWMRKKTKDLRAEPYRIIPQEEAQALSEEQLFLLQEAALYLLRPKIVESIGDPQHENLTERPFCLVEIDIDPRRWFGFGNLTVLREELSAVILERVIQISKKHPLLPVQVSLTGRYQRELPTDFTLQLVIALANHHFFIYVNRTVNEDNVPERLRGYLRSLYVWPDPADLTDHAKLAFQYLNSILRQQLQLQAH